jgi:hypothetical protein
MYTQTKDYPMYVAGEWTSGGSDARIEATSPRQAKLSGPSPRATARTSAAR